jgi:hypothetical protein
VGDGPRTALASLEHRRAVEPIYVDGLRRMRSAPRVESFHLQAANMADHFGPVETREEAVTYTG